MSDHSIATRRYAFLTPGSFAAWARRSHSSALALCSWALDGISSGPRLAFPDRLNPLGADWFHSCDGLPVSFGTACALYGLRRKENVSRFRTIQVSLIQHACTVSYPKSPVPNCFADLLMLIVEAVRSFTLQHSADS